MSATVAALAIAALTLPSPARSQSQESTTPSSSASPPMQTAQSAPALDAKVIPASATVPGAQAPRKTIEQQVKSFVAKITPERLKRDLEFRKASEKFPEFCKHWEQNLRERQQNNLQKLSFTAKDGYQTSTYTGYGKVAGCEAHQSKDGYSIGKITYEEFVYYLTGKTQDEARKAAPKPISDTHTTEIFRWENNKWFY